MLQGALVPVIFPI